MRRPLTTPLLLVILCSLVLSACGSARRTPQITAPVTITPAPTATRTTQVVTRTPYASQTPRPVTVTRTPIYPTHPPTETPTLTPFPASTPQGGAETYRLKPWDYRTAFHLFDEAEAVPLAEEYEDLRFFYQLSMLYEIYMKMPEYKTDQDLLRKLADLKGLDRNYWEPYGLLHDHSVESYRQLLELWLNEAGALPATPDEWTKKYPGTYYGERILTSNHLFDQPGSATIIKVEPYGKWNFFIIRRYGSGPFEVFALYPEWKPYWWNEETFQITDLNANGRDEITIEYNAWGTGSSHFCDQKLTVYEWNGSIFENKMGEELLVSIGTDYGDCIPFTYPTDSIGGQMIQTGTRLYTACSDVPYEERLNIQWDGKKFRKATEATITEPNPDRIDHCTVDWAVKAGYKNEHAVQLLDSALKNWPEKASEDWGPAGRDYLRLKLAVWYIQLGQMDNALTLLQEARDHPFAPDYKISSKVADTFLQAFQADGIYYAVRAVGTLYSDELSPFCGNMGCNAEEIRDNFGFFEQMQLSWWTGAKFNNDFSFIDALALSLHEAQPYTLNETLEWLKQVDLYPVWSVQSDMDGEGEEDWLVQTRIGLGYSQYFAFLRSEGQTKLRELREIVRDVGASNNPMDWQSFRPSTASPPVNVLQVDENLYAFRLLLDGNEINVEMDVSPRQISGWIGEDPAETLDWKIENNQLIVQYKGREAIYAWDAEEQKLVPTGYAPDLQEENIGKAEQAIYYDNNSSRAIEILERMTAGRIWENYAWSGGVDIINPPRVRPYALYLLGLAYEQAGDSDNAVRAYWQLWYDYPTNPYSIAAQSKLERK